MNLYIDGKLIKSNIEVADNLKKRIIGLINKKNEDDLYLFIPKCNNIHTFFMKFAIDIIMVDKNNRIIYLKENLKPFRLLCCLKAKDTIELKKDSIKKFDIKLYQKVELK